MYLQENLFIKELCSNKEDSFELVKKLSDIIDFYRSFYQEVISGKYYSPSFDEYNDYRNYSNDTITFYFKFQ